MKYLVNLLLFLFITHISSAADTLAINDAILKKRIAVTALGNGGLGDKSARLVLTNNISADLNILVHAGLQLNSEDPNAQDLVILEESILFVKGKSTAAFDMFGACTQGTNYCPKKEEKYRLSQTESKELAQIAQIISKYKMQSVNGQSAVWTFTENNPIDGVFHPDYVDASWDMARIIAVYRKENPPSKEEIKAIPTPPRQIVFSARTDIVYHAPRDTKVQLAIYDTLGNIVKEQFPLKATFGDLHIYTIGINNILEQNTTYYARLKDENGQVLLESALTNNQAYSEVMQKLLNVNFEYIVRQPSMITMTVYDAEDHLIQEIFKDRKEAVSKRNTNFKFYHAFPKGQELQVKLTNAEGEVIHTQKIVAN